MTQRLTIGALAGVVLCTLAACETSPKPAAEANRAQRKPKNYMDESRAAFDRRMSWWADARFGMFIHWGVYSELGGVYKGETVEGIAEWIMGTADIPKDEYEKYARRFIPKKFDADRWAELMKKAGMKYVVITSKHHDGFCMFETDATEYGIVDYTPYGEDVLAKLSEACRERGIRFGVYYSILDWHHPAQKVEKRGEGYPPPGYENNRMKPGRKDEYMRYMKTQLRELVEQYDPAIMWFDGEWVDWWTSEDGKELYNYVRSLKPSILVNNRVGKGRSGMEGIGDPEAAGDFGTPEQSIPPEGLEGVYWESCMTMNDSWGFKKPDNNWKSTAKLVHNLIDSASKGGNYLLNVGPKPNGTIPRPSVDRLKGIGRWTDRYGEALYGTHANPFPKQFDWGRITTKPGRLYLHVFKWPKNRKLTIPALKNKARGAELIAADGQTDVKVKAGDKKWTLTLPGRSAPDPVASVIELRIKGEARPAKTSGDTNG